MPPLGRDSIATRDLGVLSRLAPFALFRDGHIGQWTVAPSDSRRYIKPHGSQLSGRLWRLAANIAPHEVYVSYSQQMAVTSSERDIASVLHPFTNLSSHESNGPLVITSGDGAWVYDDKGKAYLEAASGLWCASLDFNEPRLVQAAHRQLKTLPFMHLFTSRSHSPAIQLAERLLRSAPAPMSKVFFANSGSEAADTVVKIVWFYSNALGRPQKKKIIARQDGFHGSTVAAASLARRIRGSIFLAAGQ